MSNTINCRQCKHFYVTWDPKNPMGCRMFGFKSKQLPSIIVYRSSGARCDGFEPKNN